MSSMIIYQVDVQPVITQYGREDVADDFEILNLVVERLFRG